MIGLTTFIGRTLAKVWKNVCFHDAVMLQQACLSDQYLVIGPGMRFPYT